MEVLVKKSTDFASRKLMPSLSVLTDGGKDITFGSYGPTWKLLRKIAVKALRSYMQGNALEKRIHDSVQTVLDELDKRTGEFDPNEYYDFIFINMLNGFCFGGKYEYGDEEPTKLLKQENELNDLFGNGVPEDFLPGLTYVCKSKTYRKLEYLQENGIVAFLKKKYQAARNSFDRDNLRHFCDHLILARLEAEEEGTDAVESLTESHLIQALSDLFFAGIDTSRFTLNWAMNYMLAFPDIQTKVQDEIDRVVGKDRLPTMDDRPDLGYTEAVMYESMRLATVAPFGINHMTSCDTEVGGYKLPEGTIVSINHWALHHDPDVWEDVDTFIPERYLDDNGRLGPKPENWTPFSAGQRGCLGEFVAKPNLHLIFASLLQRNKWRMLSGRCADLTPCGNSFVLTSKHYKVVIERRS